MESPEKNLTACARPERILLIETPKSGSGHATAATFFIPLLR
jgi:hypothetical protein